MTHCKDIPSCFVVLCNISSQLRLDFVLKECSVLSTLAILLHKFLLYLAFFCLAHNTDCFVLRTLAILRKFAPVPIGTLCSFPLSVQFNALLLVLVTVSHKNTPNTGCPVLGVHITCSSSSFRFRLCAKISHVHIQAFLHKLYYTIPQPYHMAY